MIGGKDYGLILGECYWEKGMKWEMGGIFKGKWGLSDSLFLDERNHVILNANLNDTIEKEI